LTQRLAVAWHGYQRLTRRGFPRQFQELVHGSNWFRHLLGLGFAAVIVIRVVHAIRG
jgi:hypothetical protein